MGAPSPKRDGYAKYVKNTGVPLNQISIQMPEQGDVDLRGYYDPDTEVKQGSAAYYADPFAFIVQIAAQSAITDSEQNSQLLQIQNEANKVTLPYMGTASSLDLTQYCGHRCRNQGGLYHLNLNPVFFMSQDSKTLSVKSVAELRNKNDDSSLHYQNVIEVVSSTYTNMMTQEELSKEVKNLFNRLIYLTMQDIDGRLNSDSRKHSNLRFKMGESNRFERGLVLDDSCPAIVLRNLRGWLIQAPDSKKELCQV